MGTSKARKGGGSGYGNDNSKLKHPPPRAYPGRAFDVFSFQGGREFDELSLPGGGAFDHYS